MKVRILNIFFTAAFMAMILIPLAFINLSGGGISEQENRMLAARPPISYAISDPRDFIKQFDEWFVDNVGFREIMISSYKSLDKIEKQGRYMDGNYVMLIGENGHHYFANNGNMIEKFQGKPVMTDEQLQGMANGLTEIKQYLDERNIPLIVMFCADKETIYPEYYPKSIKRGSEPVQLDIITEYVKNHTDVDIFNIKETLLASKENYPVFDKVGDATGILSHYNEIGAFFSYRELIKHINVYMPKIKPFTIDDVDIIYKDKGVYKNIPDVLLKQELSYRIVESDLLEEYLNHPSELLVFENNDSALPTILFLCDSYAGSGNYLSRYIPQHFGRTILIHWRNIQNLKKYIDFYKPDIVVFESAERVLKDFANYVINRHLQ